MQSSDIGIVSVPHACGAFCWAVWRKPIWARRNVGACTRRCTQCCPSGAAFSCIGIKWYCMKPSMSAPTTRHREFLRRCKRDWKNGRRRIARTAFVRRSSVVYTGWYINSTHARPHATCWFGRGAVPRGPLPGMASRTNRPPILSAPACEDVDPTAQF